jgi:hypothetical protein
MPGDNSALDTEDAALIEELVGEISIQAQALESIADSLDQIDPVEDHQVVVNRQDLATVVDNTLVDADSMDEFPTNVADAAERLKRELEEE